MKFFFIILFVLVSLSNLCSQEINLFGTIKSETGIPLENSSIFINNRLIALSDENGFYSFKSKFSNSIVIKVRSLGYKTVKKKIALDTNIHNYKYNFILKKKTFLLDEIKIETKAVSLYDKSDWTILGFLIVNDTVVLLSSEITSNFLYLFKLNGKLISKTKLELKYKQIVKSCLGGLHLIGVNICSEILIINKKIRIIDNYSRERYDSILVPCIFKHDTTLLFESYSLFNKKISILYFDKYRNQKVVYDYFNEEEAFSAKNELGKIISLYHAYVSIINKDITQIQVFDIIESGDWKGNLDDLIINDDLMFRIMMFKNTTLKKQKLYLFHIGNDLCLYNHMINQIVKIDIRSNRSTTYKCNIGKCKKTKLIADNSRGINYLICNNKNIYKIIQKGNNFGFDYMMKLDSKYNFPENILIDNNYIFFQTYDYLKTTYNSLIRIKLK